MERHAQLLFFADAIFVLVFSICCLLYANHDVFLIILVVVGLLTVYPLYRYIDTYISHPEDQTAKWALDHYNMLMLYCLLRFFMLFGFFSWVIIDMSGINVFVVFSHFPAFVIASLVIMTIMFLFFMVITLKMVPKQREIIYKLVNEYEDDDCEQASSAFIPPKVVTTFF